MNHKFKTTAGGALGSTRSRNEVRTTGGAWSDRTRGVLNMWFMLILCAMACLMYFPLSQKVIAANTAKPAPPPTGITLSPALAQVNIQSTEAQHRLDFKITNNENTPQTIGITTADFNTLEETGGLVFVGANPTALQKKYGLATWITLPQTTVTVPPKQSTTITAFILNQSSMAPGGHYGAIMLRLAENSGGAKGQNKVALHPIASSLLFVDKVGGDTHVLSLSDVYATHSIFTLPSSVTLRFKNEGNTHLIPRGEVTIKDSRGKLISKGIINENSGIILPETYRRYSVPLTQLASTNLPGKYTLQVAFHFDGYNQFRTYQASMILLAPIALVLAIVVLVTIAGGGFYASKKFKKARKHLKK